MKSPTALILEGIITTLDPGGAVNIAPMGPEVELRFEQMVLKPYCTSTTFQNLKRTGQAVFHVTDDVELIARAAVGPLDPFPAHEAAEGVEGRVLSDTCQWYALRMQSLDDREERTRIVCDVVARGRRRDFFGFNRAKHAVLEMAILATRTRFLTAEKILSEFERLQPAVDKTGGLAERRAFRFLLAFVQSEFAARGTTADRGTTPP